MLTLTPAFRLTTAQRGLWFTQKLSPGAILNIAEAVEIHGALSPRLFQEALRRVASEAEQLRVRIVEHDGVPRQIPRAAYAGEFPFLDLSGESDPQNAAAAWMTEEWRGPVDLANDPLWVSALLKVAGDRFIWYHRAHHIACDGYGGGLVARRLAEIYTAYAHGCEPAPNRFTTVAEVVEAEENYRRSPQCERDREYWLRQLAGTPHAVTLARRGGHELGREQRRSTGYWSAESCGQLAELAQRARISLPQILTGVMAAYFHRATGASELVFNMPVAGRLGALRNAVSLCANMGPLRVSISPETTAPELFAQVSRLAGQALRHQQYRYEDLRRELGLMDRNQNIAWLGVNIELFDYQLDFGGASGSLHNLSNGSIDDLVVFVYGHGAGMRFDLDANPSLYSTAELEEHRRRVTRLVEEVLAHPDAPLGELDILESKERQRLLVGWNATAGMVGDTTLPARVAEWAARSPQAPAIVFEDSVLAYRELHERSIRQAGLLMAGGVKPGDIVGVALPRSEQLPIVLLAIMRAGAAYLPLDVEGPPQRVAAVLEDARPFAVIAAPGLGAALPGGEFLRIPPEEDAGIPGGPALDHGGTSDLSSLDGTAYVLYTSGSTGRPKGVEVTHRNLGNFLEGMKLQLAPSPADCYLALTNVVFDISCLELFLPLAAGARVVMAGSSAVRNPPALARLIRRCGVTHMQATPSLWRILLAAPESKLERVHVLVGGEALSAALAAQLQAAAARVTHFYGPTETTVWSTVFELGTLGDDPPPIGRPILNTQAYVLDNHLQPVPTGMAGELYIGGAGVAKGYWNRPELTAERFLVNPFAAGRMYRTGDLVRWREDGVLEFIGREDAQVKIHGYRVELGEIESLLLGHAEIAAAVVGAHAGPEGSLALAAYLVPRGAVQIDLDSVRDLLASRLPAAMVPTHFLVLDALPLTASGKLDRKALPVPERVSRDTYVAPATPGEIKLADLWRQVLKIEQVGVHDNFFELGGDSVKAAEIAARFPAWFQKELPLGSLFASPTIAGLAAMLAGGVRKDVRGDRDPLAVLVPLRTTGGGRPLFCIHPAIGVSTGFSALLRHLDSAIPVYGLQSRGLRGHISLPERLEEVAGEYLERIRRIQPQGPYRLLGRSVGGPIAHAIAAAMGSQGLELELLAMIDSYVLSRRSRLQTEADEVMAALRFLDISIPREKAPRTLHALNEMLLQDRALATPRVRGAVNLAEHIGVGRLSSVIHNNLRLARAYKPSKVNVDLLYFQAMEKTGDLGGIVDDSPYAWAPFVAGIEVHPLACHHEAVMEPVPAARIANRIQRQLSSTRGRRASGDGGAAAAF